MEISQGSIPDATIEAVARSLFKETNIYGFQHVDYLRFVNLILDMSIKNKKNGAKGPKSEISYEQQTRLDFPLSSERVLIRKFDTKTDMAMLKRWIGDKEGRYFLLSRITSRNVDVQQLTEDEKNIIGVITLKDSTPIGVLAFFDFDKFQRKAELRKLIGDPNFRGRGYAKEATKLWMQYGVTKLRLNKIYLNTLDTNIRNIKLNEELGFKVEGILRNECYFDGDYHDILKMGFLSDHE